MKDYRLKAEPGHYGITGHDARLIHTVRKRVLQDRIWWLIAIWFVLTVASIIASYFTSDWVSVAVTTFFAMVTFLVGLKMLTAAVETTREIR